MDLALDVPQAPSSSRTVALSSSEREIGRTVATLLDGELERRAPTEGRSWVAHHLGVPADQLLPETSQLGGWRYIETAWALAVAMEAHATEVAPAGGDPDPVWLSWPVPEGSLRLPASLTTVFPAGALAGVAVGLQIRPFQSGEACHLTPVGSPGRTNVHGLFRNRQVLQRLGLGLDRGVLLTGPPGTGKTHLCQVVASELADAGVTVLLPDPDAARSHLAEVYELAARLAPSLVILEDVDLIAGRRGTGGGTTLVDLLVAIDGAMTNHVGVVTIATTNDVAAIDDAAKRAARFDRVIELPAPELQGRRHVWERYLRGFDGAFDLDLLARRSDGATGADVREVVRRAVLEGDGVVTDVLLLRLVREARFASDGPRGHYL